MAKALMESEVRHGQDIGEEQRSGFLRLKKRLLRLPATGGGFLAMTVHLLGLYSLPIFLFDFLIVCFKLDDGEMKLLGKASERGSDASKRN
jgi:hypothetical protein